MINTQCFRTVREYRGVGNNPNELRDFYPTGNTYKTITMPVMDGDYLAPAFSKSGETSNQERMDLQNARLQWNRDMRTKMPGFQKRKYKYVTVTTVEG